MFIQLKSLNGDTILVNSSHISNTNMLKRWKDGVLKEIGCEMCLDSVKYIEVDMLQSELFYILANEHGFYNACLNK